MSKFSNRSGSEDRGRSRSRADKKPGKTASGDNDRSKNYKAKRSFTKNKSFRDTKETKPGDRPRRSFAGSDERKPFKKDYGNERSGSSDRPKRNFSGGDDKKPFKKDFGKDQYADRPRRSFKDGSKDDKFSKPRRDSDSFNDRKSFRDTDTRPKRDFEERSSSRDESTKPKRNFDDSADKRSFKKVIKKKEDKFSGFKKATGKYSDRPKSGNNDAPAKRRFTKPRKNVEGETTRRVKFDEFEEGKAFAPQASRETFGNKRSAKKAGPAAKQTGADGLMRLNKYLSNAGVASRRDADNLILSGVVKVNGVVVDKLGTKINPTDKVTYGDATVKAERKVYLLLNKPKDYITTVDDPKERKTVMELITGACRERIYPVGRLDRNTTGLLLFTNDGEMTTKLTHPKFGVKKVYHVSLNKGLKPEDFAAIVEGVELEDGIVKADDLAFVGEGKKEVGIEIHSGRNRIVRRIFEHLGYDVIKLDRVVFAGLTKKDLPRGKHRFLTAREISFLQMIG